MSLSKSRRRCEFAFSRRGSRPSYGVDHPPNYKRAQGRPGARRTHGPRATKKARGSNHRSRRINRPSLRNGFNGFLRALLGDRALLPPSFRGHPQNLAPASGRQDHTTSPSAVDAVRQRAACVHRIPRPTSVTIAKRPSRRRRDGDRYSSDLGQTGKEMFLRTGLDRWNQIELSRQNRRLAQTKCGRAPGVRRAHVASTPTHDSDEDGASVVRLVIVSNDRKECHGFFRTADVSQS